MCAELAEASMYHLPRQSLASKLERREKSRRLLATVANLNVALRPVVRLEHIL
jgi:hypothetical protein